METVIFLSGGQMEIITAEADASRASYMDDLYQDIIRVNARQLTLIELLRVAPAWPAGYWQYLADVTAAIVSRNKQIEALRARGVAQHADEIAALETEVHEWTVYPTCPDWEEAKLSLESRRKVGKRDQTFAKLEHDLMMVDAEVDVERSEA